MMAGTSDNSPHWRSLQLLPAVWFSRDACFSEHSAVELQSVGLVCHIERRAIGECWELVIGMEVDSIETG